jgi:hypothetical protein
MRNKLDSKFMEGQDWSKQDAVLARELKVSPTTVWRWRRMLHKPKPPTYRAHPQASLYRTRKAWNWSLSNIELARIHNISRERVRQIRKTMASRRNAK